MGALTSKLQGRKSKGLPLLYRGWSDDSCGKIPGLNTENRITPLAFQRDPSWPLIPLPANPDARRMIDNHILARSQMLTEFSSWAESPYLAWSMITNHQDPSARISVLDRTIPHEPATFYHVVDLYESGNAARPYTELLAHGIVEGPGLTTMSLRDMNKLAERWKKKYEKYRKQHRAQFPLDFYTFARLPRDLVKAIAKIVWLTNFPARIQPYELTLFYTEVVVEIYRVPLERDDERYWSNEIYSFIRGILAGYDGDAAGALRKDFAQRRGLKTRETELTSMKEFDYGIILLLDEPEVQPMLADMIVYPLLTADT